MEINNAAAKTIDVDSEDITEKIARYDWFDHKNFDRRWVSAFLPHLQRNVNEVIKSLGYAGFEIVDLWFQQYSGKASHGWHTHGHQFSGVYYLEYPDKTKPTELLNPYTNASTIPIPTISEGDILIAPAHLIHRVPPHNLDQRRTVIVFNFYIQDVSDELLLELS
jgi:hypothetical protein